MGFANRYQALLSAAVEPANPFASGELSVQATINADGMTIRLILEAAGLDMYLVRPCPCRSIKRVDLTLAFLSNLDVDGSPGVALPVWACGLASALTGYTIQGSSSQEGDSLPKTIFNTVYSSTK